MSQMLESITMNEPRFMALLEKLIGESVHLQNSPASGLIPKESLACKHILDVLNPFSKENGGVLSIKKIEFVEGRGNMIITYPGTNPNKVCSFVGSHLDVVPANPQNWERDPFKLTVDGDSLYGRGTTDCLGHVALLTDLLATLAEKKPALQNSLVVVFIANEENGTFKGVGVDQLALEGYMTELLKGPLFWIDSADTHPCIGTAGNLQWRMDVTGKAFHSGLPHKGINAIEFGFDALAHLQKVFSKSFPRHEREQEYNFKTQSSLKATRCSSLAGAVNIIPGDCIIEGDVRLAPFYDVETVKEILDKEVALINANPAIVEDIIFHGAQSKYTLPDENLKAKLSLTWTFPGENGVACNLKSPGHIALKKATGDVIGSVNPYGIGGSLPLIRQLSDQGFDVQIAGYGLSSRYHADNEYVSLADMKNATRILTKIIQYLEV